MLSDRILVRVTAGPGQSFLDKMIALVEGARRQRTPNEIALTLVLTAFTLIFMIVVVPLWPMAFNAEQYMTSYLGLSDPLHSLGTDVPTLVALIVCLIPTTIGALLAAIGIAGMDRALRANIIAKSGKAVEVAGDIDTVLLDKTGTITLGDRRAKEFTPLGDASKDELMRLAALASVADQTPEGKSIVAAYEATLGGRSRAQAPAGADFVPFTAQTRMSGIDLADGAKIRKGAVDAIVNYVESVGGAGSPRPRVDGGAYRRARRNPARGRGERSHRRRRRARGYSEAGHSRPHGATPVDGTAHGDDHRRQPTHRASHCA